MFTTLTKEAFPVIRYRTRDLTELLPGSARPGMRRIAKITGRNDDMIILRGVNLFPTQIEEIALEQHALSTHFIIELTRVGKLDSLTIKIEPREGISADQASWAANTPPAGHQDAHRVLSRCRACCLRDSVERSQGKLKRVYDLRE